MARGKTKNRFKSSSDTKQSFGSDDDDYEKGPSFNRDETFDDSEDECIIPHYAN